MATEEAVVGDSKFPFRQEDLYFEGLAEKNSTALTDLRSLLQARGVPDERDRRPLESEARHHTASWSYVQAMQLLESWVCSPAEKEQLDRLLFLITAVQDERVERGGPIDLPVTVIGMDNLRKRGRSRGGTSMRISRLAQGRASTKGYPGDDAFRDSSSITLQLHMIQPGGLDGGGVVPALAVGIPDGWERRVYWELPR